MEQPKKTDQQLKSIKNRAAKLGIAELKELTQLVGIQFVNPEDNTTDETASAEEYIDVLDEADDRQKVLDYLKKKGV